MVQAVPGLFVGHAPVQLGRYGMAVLLGMLPKEYAARAHAAYDGVIRSLSWQGDDIQIGGVCVGTGVGTYDFYCGRPCSVSDLHGVGAFLLMCAAMQQLQDAGL